MSDLALDLAAYDRRDPSPALALALDRSLPFAAEAKEALIRDQNSRSRQFLLPVVRPFARLWIVAAQLVHTVSPRWPHAPRFLHRSIGWGMRHFLTPDANRLILRHFHLGAEILRFISDNATPGYHPELEPMRPRRVQDVETESVPQPRPQHLQFPDPDEPGAGPPRRDAMQGRTTSTSRRSATRSSWSRCRRAGSTSSTCRPRSRSTRRPMRCC